MPTIVSRVYRLPRTIKDISEPITSFEHYKRQNNDFISRYVSLRGKKVAVK